MSRINDLVREFCPHGVPFIAIKDLFEIRNGYTPSKADVANWTDGTIPWFRMEDIRQNGRILSSSIQYIPMTAVKGGRLFPANSIIVATSATIGEHALVTVPSLCNQRFTALWPKPASASMLDMKFVFYYCFVLDEWCRNNTTTSSFASVDMDGFKRFRFPVPPLDVQREVVRVLDAFSDLEAELEAELEARRRQYGHYRDSLLLFSDGQTAALRELGSLYGGLTGKTKADFSDGNARFVSYMNVFRNPAADLCPEDFVRVAPKETQNCVQFGDVLFTASSESADEVGMSSIVTTEPTEPLYLNSFCFGFRPHHPDVLNPEFAKHLFRSDGVRRQIIRTANGVTRFNISKERFRDVRIPLLGAEEQKRLAGILNKLEALVNDPAIGIPGELKARRKQHEYYRGRVLTFPEAA